MPLSGFGSTFNPSAIRAVQRFDAATNRHCLIVKGLAAAFVTELGFVDLDSYRLTKAALLRDVGKPGSRPRS